MEKHTRRLFVDLQEDGKVIISAPKRTAFDYGSFPVLSGNSSEEEFVGEFSACGRRWTVQIISEQESHR
ncbi:MAG TPA: hypothetical protein VNL91_03845 [Thermoanaerobaculia bacterium]|nr:hypothetical protein [Thermoanaerobaculia bacterium]